MRNNPNIQLLTAAVLSIGGLVLLFCGVFIDPQGEIHTSLLVAFGETSTFAGALFGIAYTYRMKYNGNEQHIDPPADTDAGKSR